MTIRLVTVLILICGMSVIAATVAQIAPPREQLVSIRHERGDVRIIGSDQAQVTAFLIQRLSGTRTPVEIEVTSRGASLDTNSLVPPDYGPIDLEVTLPRTAKVGPVTNPYYRIEVSGVTTPLDLETERGEIRADSIAGGRISTKNGNVNINGLLGPLNIKTVNGTIVVTDASTAASTAATGRLLDIVISNGNIRLLRVANDVRIVAVNSNIRLECVRGSIEIRDTNSQIDVTSPAGNLDINSPNGQVNIYAPAAFSASYRLKTLSGALVVAIPADVGFSYKLSSYKGRIENEFIPTQPHNRTDSPMTGKYLSGKAMLDLDTFDGGISLLKRPAAAIGCKRK
jgi:hypothetical protein